MYRPVLSRGKYKGTDPDNEVPKSRTAYAIKRLTQNDYTADHSQVLLRDKGFPTSIHSMVEFGFTPHSQSLIALLIYVCPKHSLEYQS